MILEGERTADDSAYEFDRVNMPKNDVVDPEIYKLDRFFLFVQIER